MKSLSFAPIGVVRSPLVEKVDAPRQGVVARDVEGTIELERGMNLEHAIEDLDAWERIWIVFVFDRVSDWRAKVRPPRSDKRRGVLATRSPHRPNPIGISAVRLVAIDKPLTLRVRELDILDGSPVLDVKPYVPYADAFPEAGSGWLDPARDPIAEWAIEWSDEARAHIAWLEGRGVELAPRIEAALKLGPAPNAYRRIKRDARGLVLALKEWRVRFTADEAARLVRVEAITSGYRARDLAIEASAAIEIHRAFMSCWKE